MSTLAQVIEQIFGRPLSDFRDEDGPATFPDWDSHAHMELLSQLEEAYHISFTVDEQLELETLGDVKAALHSRGIRL
ncbi:MAG: acyl carrier protein [Myxococcota bacterium]